MELGKLDVVGTKQFISAIMREKFDYTKWQRQRFNNMTSEAFQEAAAVYTKDHSFTNEMIRSSEEFSLKNER